MEEYGNSKLRKYPKIQSRDQTDQTSFLTIGYFEWLDDACKGRLQLNGTIFELFLSCIRLTIIKQPTSTF